jgi:hypothetical protein
MFQNGLFKYVKILDITIGYFVEFIFLVMFLPLCVFKIRHLIKINIIFARKYFVLIIFLIISYILLEKVLGRMASNLPCMEFIGEYTFVNPAEIIRNFPPFLTIICYKNRRIIKTGIKYAISNLTGGGKDPP